MTINSRNKGASFERLIAKDLFLRVGVYFKRNLEQTQTKDLGDLIADDPCWPFSIECKHANIPDHPAWRRQAVTAAKKAKLAPCVVWRITGRPVRVSVPLSVFEGPSDEWADLTLDGFCWLAREMMADRAGIDAATEPGDAR